MARRFSDEEVAAHPALALVAASAGSDSGDCDQAEHWTSWRARHCQDRTSRTWSSFARGGRVDHARGDRRQKGSRGWARKPSAPTSCSRRPPWLGAACSRGREPSTGPARRRACAAGRGRPSWRGVRSERPGTVPRAAGTVALDEDDWMEGRPSRPGAGSGRALRLSGYPGSTLVYAVSAVRRAPRGTRGPGDDRPAACDRSRVEAVRRRPLVRSRGKIALARRHYGSVTSRARETPSDVRGCAPGRRKRAGAAWPSACRLGRTLRDGQEGRRVTAGRSPQPSCGSSSSCRRTCHSPR